MLVLPDLYPRRLSAKPVTMLVIPKGHGLGPPQTRIHAFLFLNREYHKIGEKTTSFHPTGNERLGQVKLRVKKHQHRE